jgi:tripartite-type tricarboxylate transporter receptor subunit TctC
MKAAYRAADQSGYTTHTRASPEMRERFVAQGVDVASSTPEAFAALIRAEIPRWRELVKRSGAKAD